jgi:hypothetical protein
MSPGSSLKALPQRFEFPHLSCRFQLARNLYVALRPAAADAAGRKSPMDFRSNEAGRTARRLDG